MTIPSVPIPDDLKQRLRNHLVETVAHWAEEATGDDRLARTIRQLSSQAAFYNAFDLAVANALKRFSSEYLAQDEDLVEAITTDGNFWQSRDIRQALMKMINHPGARPTPERETVVRHFTDVLPKRINRERVDKAITFLLGCILEELWSRPGVSEIRAIYSLQFQR